MSRLTARRGFVLACLAGFGLLSRASRSARQGTIDAAAAQDGWAVVLRKRVDAQGRVDFAALQRDPGPLEAYVAYVAATAPDSFTDPASRLAFLINSYNALAMHHVLAFDIPTRLTLLGRARFFKFSKETVGGQRISLYDYENDVIRTIGDARVHFALNCMSVSCPRLPRQPFTAASLNAELDAAARSFFDELCNVTVDDAVRILKLSAIMDFYTADFLRHAPSLAAYVNRYRAAPVPTDYAVRFFDYDWTINRQPGTW